uniref:AP2/ERF domain-containing protein n=1 Tax=Oryza meridionalis TaxID=40149 RepID=A0A0E0FE52_9ORYZ
MTSSATATPASPKRSAGRTKFHEMRHPVFRGVRRRGCAGRWVFRGARGARGDRLWVGTFDTAEETARAHDAAMLALCGASASLNFTDSAWLLHILRAPVVSGLRPPAARRAARRQQGRRRVLAPGEYRHCHCHLRRCCIDRSSVGTHEFNDRFNPRIIKISSLSATIHDNTPPFQQARTPLPSSSMSPLMTRSAPLTSSHASSSSMLATSVRPLNRLATSSHLSPPSQ